MTLAAHRRRLAVRALVLVLLLLGAGPALAHADYQASDPPRDALLETAPERVELIFTEPVETRFSIFKVYPLEHDSLGAAALAEPDFLRLNGLAATLVNDVLQLRDDADARADLGLVDPADRSAEVTLALPPDLAPGAYVVMWRVLATDSHTTQGHLVFVIGPNETGDAP